MFHLFHQIKQITWDHLGFIRNICDDPMFHVLRILFDSKAYIFWTNYVMGSWQVLRFCIRGLNVSMPELPQLVWDRPLSLSKCLNCTVWAETFGLWRVLISYHISYMYLAQAAHNCFSLGTLHKRLLQTLHEGTAQCRETYKNMRTHTRKGYP